MSLGKQAKVLTKAQIETISNHLLTRRHGLRDQTIFLLSTKAGLRATEIAGLKWSMVTNSDGDIGDAIHITDNGAVRRMRTRIRLLTQPESM
ncbi:site-specific integrase, partial [Planktomarina temperata]|nr:site-specific integrase [Planktomarina temperata]